MIATWNFGDGTGNFQAPSYTSPVLHTFTTNGTYTVTETLSSPALGSVSGTLNVTVTNLPNTKITYTNTTHTGSGLNSSIGTVKFLQGGVTVYTFTTAQLISGATVTPGNYTIQIYPVGPQFNAVTAPNGWNGVSYNGTFYQYFPYSTSTPFSVTDNLTYEPNITIGIQ